MYFYQTINIHIISLFISKFIKYNFLSIITKVIYFLQPANLHLIALCQQEAHEQTCVTAAPPTLNPTAFPLLKSRDPSL